MQNIYGIGTDIIETTRIARMIEQHGDHFLRRIYTEKEIAYCNDRKNAIEHFAGRWAAKEAIFKAIGTGWRGKIDWTDFEIRHDDLGKPQVFVQGNSKDALKQMGIADIMMSISHCRSHAVAMAIAFSLKMD